MITHAEEIRELQFKVEQQMEHIDVVIANCHKRIVGQDHMIRSLLTGLLTRGHILLEGMPGLAKTLAIKTLAAALEGKFSRIQFTPDLLPADVTGTMIYDPVKQTFAVKKGPIFANFVLADEINRAPAKVQSALLEAMQERQVTIGDQTFVLEEPFVVLATQNPIEQEGTYPLPEAQLDRFMMKVHISYPSQEEERAIIRSNARIQISDTQESMDVVGLHHILESRPLIDQIYIDARIEQYILDLVFATRNPEKFGLQKHQHLIRHGASPRAGINLALGAKAQAFMQKRAFVLPEDVRSILPDVMRHRISLDFEAEARGIYVDDILKDILQTIAIP
jgi:MoxR-like ATPase